MNVTWSDLVEQTPDNMGPNRAATENSTVEVIGYERHVIAEADASGTSLVRDTLTEQFAGGINGQGLAEHIRHLRPDGSNTFVGIERISARINGRSGSLSLTCHGTTRADGVVHGVWRVIPGSGTDQLAGLLGRGEFTAHPQPNGRWQAQDTFTYWYEPE